MKELIKKSLPKSCLMFFNKYLITPLRKKYKQSWAQCGEDLILDTILQKQIGFYIDIGANSPLNQSNTMYFYNKGWRGINIDATPGSMIAFKKLRKRDINLEMAISNEEQELTFYMFKPSLYNSFEKRFMDSSNTVKLVGEKLIKTSKLSKILDKYLGNNEIDFITVDAEGFDYDILKSNNWKKYRPKVVVVEYITYQKSELDRIKEITELLELNDYKFFCNSPTNGFFLENKFYTERFG